MGPVWSILSLVVGLALLVAGAGLLVRGASELARLLKISPLMIGLTVVAFGTSMPELLVSTSAAAGGEAGIAIGNVVGSNIFNVLAILGISAVVSPLIVSSQLIRIDVPVMIGASVVMLVMALDGTFGRFDGLLLVAGLAAYTAFTIWYAQHRKSAPPGLVEPGPAGISVRSRSRTWAIQLGLVALGLGLLVIGSRQTVVGASEIAASLGVSSLIIGLTVIAAGTSLPELATSVLASFRGERDLAVGNVVGSNIFNVLGVLGLSSLVSESGLPVARSLLVFDLPVVIVTAVACLPIFFTGNVIARWEGALFCAYFLLYLIYLYLQAAQRSTLELLNVAVLTFVVPLTALTLAILTARQVGRGNRPR
jgi:cation:H+ antiporter